MNRFRPFYQKIMSRFRSSYRKLVENYKKFLKEIKKNGRIAHYDYKKVIEQIKAASYPASLGMINLGLYQYMKGLEAPEPTSPEIFFLIASILFFFISAIIGLGIGIAMEEPPFKPAEQQELKYRQAFIIVIAFIMAIVFDLLGLLWIVAMHVASA